MDNNKVSNGLQPVIKVEDLTVAYDSRPVLWDVDLEIPPGKLVAVVGPNGAGKSTLLKAILGLVKTSTGSVTLHPRLGKGFKKIGYVEQTKEIDWDFPATVMDVVLMGRYGHLGWIKRPTAHDKQVAQNALERVGMSEYKGRQIRQLSGGQQQRVFLARALAQEAELYFMDEPFKGVDIKTEHTIIEILKEIRDAGKTVMVVHHDLKNIKNYFDWVVLVNVAVVASGAVEQVFSEENIEKTYSRINPILQAVQR